MDPAKQEWGEKIHKDEMRGVAMDTVIIEDHLSLALRPQVCLLGGRQTSF